MTFVIGDIKHANLVDFLLSQLGYSVPCADDTNRLQRLRVYLAFSFVQADRNQPQREISAPCLTLSSQMRWPKLCGCLCSSLAHGFPSSKPFSDKNYLCFSKSGSPNSRMNLKNKGMNRSGSRRRKEGGRRRVAANPITVAAKWFVPLGEQQIKKKGACEEGKMERSYYGVEVDSTRNCLLLFPPSEQPRASSLTVPRAAQTPFKLLNLKV